MVPGTFQWTVNNSVIHIVSASSANPVTIQGRRPGSATLSVSFNPSDPAYTNAIGSLEVHLTNSAEEWSNCGLRGYECGTGNCSCQNTTGCFQGETMLNKWVDCCMNPADAQFYCFRYVDSCTYSNVPSPSGCEGTIPSGGLWCGVGHQSANHVCTVKTSASPVGAASYSACMESCSAADTACY